jgi:hypothetical protein
VAWPIPSLTRSIGSTFWHLDGPCKSAHLRRAPRCGVHSLLLLVFCCYASLAPGAAENAEREVIQDNHFRRGFVLWEPQPGKHVRYGEVSGPDSSGKPVWGLSQWSSRYPIEPNSLSTDATGAIVLSNISKVIRFGAPPGNAPDLGLAVNTQPEYGSQARRQGEPWVHLLVEQEFADPPFLHRLASAKFHLEAKLRSSTNLHRGDYSPDLHAAQFQVFLTVQNRNKESPGYGDLVWFGIPVYDSRHRHPPEFKAKDFGGTEKFIFTPPGTTYTTRSAHDGEWITINRDLLPLMREGVELAWSRGFLSRSKQHRDYAIGGMNMGWELPGTFHVELEVRNLSLRVRTQPSSEKARPSQDQGKGIPNPKQNE